MAKKLDEGVKLNEVLSFCDDGECFVVGRLGCKSITVSMEMGNGSLVPWAVVEKDDDDTVMVNLMHAESVKLAAAGQDGE